MGEDGDEVVEGRVGDGFGGGMGTVAVQNPCEDTDGVSGGLLGCGRGHGTRWSVRTHLVSPTL